MKIVTDPGALEGAMAGQYRRVAREVARLLPKVHGTVVEVGCGRGQLTLPLARLSPRYAIVAVDAFQGPYDPDGGALRRALSEQGLEGRVRVVVSDFEDWMGAQPESAHEALVSSEFLPELDASRLRSFLGGSYRILRPGGVMVHSFLSPEPRNRAQRLLVDADSDPRWTENPPAQWFSPPPALVVDEMKSAGLRSPVVTLMASELRVKGEAARSMLDSWNVRQDFWRSHEEELVTEGLELPDWIVVSARR